jgi:hypothetical protein
MTPKTTMCLTRRLRAREIHVAECPDIWLVLRGEEVIAELALKRLDPPWFHGRALRCAGFRPLQRLFDTEERLAARVHHDPAAWAGAYRRVRSEVRLLRPDGSDVPEFLLHIDGHRARWRCWNRETTNWLDEQLTEIASVSISQRVTRRSLAAAILGLLTAMAFPATALGRPLRDQQSPNSAGTLSRGAGALDPRPVDFALKTGQATTGELSRRGSSFLVAFERQPLLGLPPTAAPDQLRHAVHTHP